MIRIVIAIILNLLAASLSDWLFMGILFHEQYRTFPEVWRDTTNERQKIIVAQIYSLMTAAGFVLLFSYAGPLPLRASLTFSGLVWLIGPLPLLLGNHLFIKLDPKVTASHATGWLAKLLLIGAITAVVL